MKPLDYKSGLVKRMIAIVQHYNPEKYWKMRDFVVSSSHVGGGKEIT